MSSQKSEHPIHAALKAELPIHTTVAAAPFRESSNIQKHETIPEHSTVNHDQAIIDLDPYATPAEYYGHSHGPRKVAKSRTLSQVDARNIASVSAPARRTSHGVY